MPWLLLSSFASASAIFSPSRPTLSPARLRSACVVNERATSAYTPLPSGGGLVVSIAACDLGGISGAPPAPVSGARIEGEDVGGVVAVRGNGPGESGEAGLGVDCRAGRWMATPPPVVRARKDALHGRGRGAKGQRVIGRLLYYFCLWHVTFP